MVIVTNIFLFKLRVHRQQQVGEEAVVLHPRVLHDDSLDRLMLVGHGVLVGVVPAGHEAGRIAPDHVNWRATGRRILVLDELVDDVVHLLRASVNRKFAVENRIVHHELGNHLLGHGQKRDVSRVYGGNLRNLLGLRHRILAEQPGDNLGREGACDECDLVDARFAEALHGQQNDLQTGRLGGVGAADVGTAEAVRNRSCGPRKSPRQSLDYARGNPALGGCPLGGFGNAVFLAENVVLELLEAYGMCLDIFLVVGVFDDPLVGNGQLQGRVGVGQNRNPFVGVHRRRRNSRPGRCRSA